MTEKREIHNLHDLAEVVNENGVRTQAAFDAFSKWAEGITKSLDLVADFNDVLIARLEEIEAELAQLRAGKVTLQ